MAVRRVLGCLVMVSLVLAGLGGSSVHAKNLDAARAEMEHYYGRVIGVHAGPYYACVSDRQVGCVEFTPRRGERAVRLEVVDYSGLPVYAQVGQWVLGDNTRYIDEKDLVSFCGRTTRPFQIDPKKGDLIVFIWEGPNSVTDCPGVASAGDVHATFIK